LKTHSAISGVAGLVKSVEIRIGSVESKIDEKVDILSNKIEVMERKNDDRFAEQDRINNSTHQELQLLRESINEIKNSNMVGSKRNLGDSDYPLFSGTIICLIFFYFYSDCF